MMVGFFNLVFDAKMPVEHLFPDKKNPPESPALTQANNDEAAEAAQSERKTE